MPPAEERQEHQLQLLCPQQPLLPGLRKSPACLLPHFRNGPPSCGAGGRSVTPTAWCRRCNGTRSGNWHFLKREKGHQQIIVTFFRCTSTHRYEPSSCVFSASAAGRTSSRRARRVAGCGQGWKSSRTCGACPGSLVEENTA